MMMDATKNNVNVSNTRNRTRRRLRMVIPAFPAFNIYSQVAKKTTALGPVCVATAAREVPGWDVEVIDENNMRRYGPGSKSGSADHGFLQNERAADVVGLYGGLTSTIPRLYEIAQFYKRRGAVTVAGGQHFTGKNIAEALRSGVDYVVRGEGEKTIQEVLRTISGHGDMRAVPGIAYLEKGKVVCTADREPLTEFEAFPMPDFSLLRYAKIKVYPIGRIRGCGMDCEFCTVKGKPRCASPERLLESVRMLVETRDARHFFIVDDLFGQQRQETLRFCGMLRDYQRQIRRRLDFTAQIRLDKAKDTQLLKMMREAGINMVAIGFESPIDEELEAMRKHITAQDMVRLSRIYHKFGFLVHGMFIFGYPLKDGREFSMSAKERIQRFRAFIKKAKIDSIQVLLPVPLPGTELRERLQREGRVYPTHEIGWEYYDGNFPLFEPDEPLTAQEMQGSLRKIMGKFYQFKYMWKLGLTVFFFPMLVFFLHDIKTGWKKWYRPWRNNLLRFGGWVVLKGWIREFKKSTFPQKLTRAQRQLKQASLQKNAHLHTPG
ncbi:MAG: radical SAM protein [Candidatus Omnitrophica bacterium]|nr:radical SAM protein [Candidatus Omnitrophota bacterium]